MFDYCPKVEAEVDQLKDDLNGDEEYLTDRKHLLEAAVRWEKRFSKFTPTNKKKVGDAVAVLEQLFFNGASVVEFRGALLMAKALLKAKTPGARAFLENFYVFIDEVRNLLSGKRSAAWEYRPRGK